MTPVGTIAAVAHGALGARTLIESVVQECSRCRARRARPLRYRKLLPEAQPRDVNVLQPGWTMR